MKVLTTISAVLLFSLGIPTSVQAMPAFLNPITGGSGCVAGSVSTSGVSTDQLTINFNSYSADASNIYAACTLILPFNLPPGFFIHAVVDSSGHIQGKAKFKRKYKSSVSNWSPWKSSSYNNPSAGNITKRDYFISPNCNGGTNTLRIYTNVKPINGGQISIDSIHIKLIALPC